MSEQILKQILDTLGGINTRLDGMDARLSHVEANMATKADIARLERKLDEYQSENIAADEKLLGLIRATSDEMTAQGKRFALELNTLGHSIDILDNRQLRLESEMRNR